MSAKSITPVGEHRRKRVRKGTRSCWECRRRKVKCTYQSEDDNVCVSCLDKGTSCLSQEFVEDQPPRHAEDSALSHRMERVEILLEKFMQKVPQGTEDNRLAYDPVGVFNPLSTPATMNHPRRSFVSTVNSALRQQPEVNTSTSSNGSPMEGIEGLQQRLAAMLPCQEDVDFLSGMSHGWWLIQRHMMPHLLKQPEHDTESLFDVLSASRSHPIVISRLLLCVAICIQQLPPKVDLRRLHTTVPLREMMENNITFITTMVTSDDEMTGSMEGVESLALQGIYQTNAGNLRRSWLTFRRAISVAQLMGLHRVSTKTSQGVPDLEKAKRHYIWYQIMQAERYLSLVLGVPSATTSAPTQVHNQAPFLSTEAVYHQKLCHISGLILTRNQGDSTHAFSATQEIDEKLDSLAKQMPHDWWEIPSAPMTSRTEETAAQFERIMCQIWHFELATLLHLPFMLRAATDRRYEYSRISCLSATRGLIRRWMSIREVPGKTLFSNLIEFQAFAAATTILLGLLGSTHTTTDQVTLQERYEDLQLVETVVQTLERLREHGTAVHLADQSITVIRTLQGVIQNEDDSFSSLRLEIPHFGTIRVTRSGAVQSLEGDRIIGANPHPRATLNGANPSLRTHGFDSVHPETSTGSAWSLRSASGDEGHRSPNMAGDVIGDNAMGVGHTVLQFTSCHFPALTSPSMNDLADWCFQESDTLCFDSLLDTDVEGSRDF
ncbi:uncharacterized protein N7487_010521 [Penicillium crustosum]|uniref:uncharacterized protein n=1 Tax=Penicillium crustosum TaxID=36656 RepID=UPI0023A0478F|nr:uncharacterized protein N7487_010521 [Penicillium crustosum]KAJ5396218.1 hypothetical protein N7487_010521 [Penicillium crustosum]